MKKIILLIISIFILTQNLVANEQETLKINFLNKIDEVNVSDIMEMAQKYFQKDKLALTAIGQFSNNKLVEKLSLF